MRLAASDQRQALLQLQRTDLESRQLARLNALLDRILPANEFYFRKLARFRRPLRSLAELADWPFTTKGELQVDAARGNVAGDTGRDDGSAQAAGAGSAGAADPPASSLAQNRTWPLSRYVRFHQTSGTCGRPLAVLDTSDDWQWWLDTWQYVLDVAGLLPGEAVLMAFSFGPFIGFWSAFEAALVRGCRAVPAGGLGSAARLELLRASAARALFCTPSYALRLAEVAAQRNFDLASLGVKCVIVAGEPGGSIASTRQRIEKAFAARVVDHAGATEVGPWGVGDTAGRGLHVIESEFVAEFLSTRTGQPAAEGEEAELVLTTLGRAGCPVIRYRTGDIVRPIWSHGRRCNFVLLEGGVLGRTDEMIIIRGVNIYPAAIEQVLRGFPDIAEYRLTVYKDHALDQLDVEIEAAGDLAAHVADELRLRLGLQVGVRSVPPDTLPRFEGKGRRLIDRRTTR